jgi:hypothetical protein
MYNIGHKKTDLLVNKKNCKILLDFNEKLETEYFMLVEMGIKTLY